MVSIVFHWRSLCFRVSQAERFIFSLVSHWRTLRSPALFTKTPTAKIPASKYVGNGVVHEVKGGQWERVGL